MRFVFDTNALISAALLKRSVTRLAYEKAISEGTLLVSAETIEEINEVLRRPQFEKYVTEAERLEFLSRLFGEVEWVKVDELDEHIDACRDPDDNKFLELAVNGKAERIITGDKDLLVLNPFRGIAILTPRAFLDEQGQPQP